MQPSISVIFISVQADTEVFRTERINSMSHKGSDRQLLRIREYRVSSVHSISTTPANHQAVDYLVFRRRQQGLLGISPSNANS